MFWTMNTQKKNISTPGSSILRIKKFTFFRKLNNKTTHKEFTEHISNMTHLYQYPTYHNYESSHCITWPPKCHSSIDVQQDENSSSINTFMTHHALATGIHLNQQKRVMPSTQPSEEFLTLSVQAQTPGTLNWHKYGHFPIISFCLKRAVLEAGLTLLPLSSTSKC